MTLADAFVPVAITRRSGFDESVHFGAVVALGPSGVVEFALGDPAVHIYPRSSNKPMQAVAMVRAGLRLPPEQLAVVCASHDGTPLHLATIASILQSAGLDESALGNTPDLPLDQVAAETVLREGGGRTALQMNCSGKHSGMLATCVHNGWSHDRSYLEQDHPLQVAITLALSELVDEAPSAIGVDGCGAPAHVVSLIGLARGFRAIATRGDDPSCRTVAEAMTRHPVLVGGERRDVTQLMRGVPGLVAKDGAEGVMAVALPDGRAVVCKIADGANRARPAVVIAALERLGVDVSAVAPLVVQRILGHGHPVGEVRRGDDMSPIPFVTLDDPEYGEAVAVSPLVRRVVAHNPSKFTYLGTGTYIVGHGEVVVIDPGPDLPSHREALERALQGERVTTILVTHCHADHSPLAAWLRAETGAPTVAFGPHAASFGADLFEGEDELDDDADREAAAAGRTAEREASPEVKIEESIDFAFEPDGRVLDGMIAAGGDGWTLTAVHTPGHTSNHTAFALDAERALFTGDHVMGWSTTVIGPPDGDMRAYFDSLSKVQRRRDSILWPTHGAPVRDPRPFLDVFVEHRRERERQVLAAVRGGEESIVDMVRMLYADVRRELHKPARRSVLAHLIKLVDDGLVAVEPGDHPRLGARFHAA